MGRFQVEGSMLFTRFAKDDKDKGKGESGGSSSGGGYQWPSDSPSGQKERKGGHR